ncbi:MAG: InlB B-repeat-containing protein, partial [Acholeplasmatales bacterium]|nr:InlB B-repeat-containing protein [Acholeplasmatales bacterium]
MSKLCKRILLILAVFSSFLTLFACSAIQIDTYHVELPQDKYQLRVGQEIEALPIVSKNGQECDLEVSYHSYDASIATYVDGKIVALKSGEVRIKVTLKNNSKVYATALVTVVNDDSLIVDFNYEKTMIKGTTQLLTYELLVEKNRKLTFTSSNENVATIDKLGNIKAITVGTTTIETVVSSLYDEGVSKTYKLVIEVKDLTFAINYVLDGGTNSENNPNEYVPEKLPLLLENPTKSGYKFVGWYDNENFTGEAITEISAGTMGDVTLYAKWNALDYRISYELNGGTNAENPDGYDVSDLPVSLHAPSRTGYIFKGWYMGENRVLAIPVGTTGNVDVSAKWEPITYTIDFDTNGGLPTLSSIDYTIESDSFTLQEITKAGYTFDGWYNGETKVTEITTGTYGNMTLVAKWTADLYTISYDLADGVNSPENPTSYTIESGLITLKDPTR